MANNENTHTHHILPLSVYLGVGTALLVLTVITVWVAQYDFGSVNLIVAMIIAAFKASLVALFFMHLKYDNKLYLLAFLSAIFFLSVFIIITMFDTLRRGDIDKIKAGPIQPKAAIYQNAPTADTTNIIVDSLSSVSDSTLTDTTKQ